MQAIELALKEILKREHRTLVFQNVDKQTVTVSLDTALARLLEIVKVRFRDDDIKNIELAIKLRNQVVHYECSFPEQQVKVVFTRLLGFAQHLFYRHLGKALPEVIDPIVWREARFLFEFYVELHQRALDTIRSENVREDYLLYCNECDSEKVVVPRGDEGVCYVCGNKVWIEYCASCGCAMDVDNTVPMPIGNTVNSDFYHLCWSCAHRG